MATPLQAARHPSWTSCPRGDTFTELEASSLAVGLPEGLMGNSEVGHLNIGAGRVVWQDVVRIDQTIKNGELKDNPVNQEDLRERRKREWPSAPLWPGLSRWCS